MPFTVRRASPEDSRRIAEINMASWETAYRGVIDDGVLDGLDMDELDPAWRGEIEAPEFGDEQRMWVVLDGERVMGYARTGPDRSAEGVPGRSAEIYGFYLDPPFHGSGAAGVLMDHVLTDFAARGYVEAALGVATANARAGRFYARHGFTADPDPHEDFHGAPQFRLRRSL